MLPEAVDGDELLDHGFMTADFHGVPGNGGQESEGHGHESFPWAFKKCPLLGFWSMVHRHRAVAENLHHCRQKVEGFSSDGPTGTEVCQGGWLSPWCLEESSGAVA